MYANPSTSTTLWVHPVTDHPEESFIDIRLWIS